MENKDGMLTFPEDGESGAAPEEETVLTVSQVNRIAKQRLESITVSVEGEVSGITTGYAYYVYFDLRDESASLPAILTQRQFKGLDFRLEDGVSVVASGTLTLYERQGKFQIRVTEVRPLGEGDLRRRIEALKRKLHAEGLFEDARKKVLPRFPERIGVVSSPRGAAVRDVVVTIRRRFPAATVFVRGIRVQGAGAAKQICEGLDFFDGRWPVDLVILARGGGSIQDLEPFNTEEVARAISRMGVPVVTGIGHEPDVTVADLVADRRASTPTGAAEASVPDRSDVMAYLADAAARLSKRAGTEVRAGSYRLAGLRRGPLFKSGEFLLGPFMQRWERAARDLPESPRRGLSQMAGRLSVVRRLSIFRKPGALLWGWISGTEACASSLKRTGLRLVQGKARELERHGTGLRVLSPLSVLERGYSITFSSETGRIIRDSAEVDVGTKLEIKLGRGGLEAEVTGKE